MNDEEIIRQVMNNETVSITPIMGKGDVNRVYAVKKDDAQVVVRLNSYDELTRFKKEAWCMKEAAKKGVPGPKLIDIGLKNKTAFMIISYISGKNGKDIVENKEIIWRKIGAYAKMINSIPTIGFGENMTSPGIFSDSWERYLTYNIESLNPNDKLLQTGAIEESQQEPIRDKLIKFREIRFIFALIHGDLSLENAIVEDDRVALIDWGVAESTIVPHMEIVDLLQNQLSDKDPLFENFLHGYEMSRKDYESIRPEIETLELLQAVDKLRWAIDKKPEQIPDFSKRVKLLYERF